MKGLASFIRGLGGCLWYGGMLLFSLVFFGWLFYVWVWPVVKVLVMLVVVLLSPIWMIIWMLLAAVWPLLATAAVLFVIGLIAVPFVQTDPPTDKKFNTSNSATADNDD